MTNSRLLTNEKMNDKVSNSLFIDVYQSWFLSGSILVTIDTQ